MIMSATIVWMPMTMLTTTMMMASTGLHTNYGESSTQTGCYATTSTVSTWGSRASIWVGGPLAYNTAISNCIGANTDCSCVARLRLKSSCLPAQPGCLSCVPLWEFSSSIVVVDGSTTTTTTAATATTITTTATATATTTTTMQVLETLRQAVRHRRPSSPLMSLLVANRRARLQPGRQCSSSAAAATSEALRATDLLN